MVPVPVVIIVRPDGVPAMPPGMADRRPGIGDAIRDVVVADDDDVGRGRCRGQQRASRQDDGGSGAQQQFPHSWDSSIRRHRRLTPHAKTMIRKRDGIAAGIRGAMPQALSAAASCLHNWCGEGLLSVGPEAGYHLGSAALALK